MPPTEIDRPASFAADYSMIPNQFPALFPTPLVEMEFGRLAQHFNRYNSLYDAIMFMMKIAMILLFILFIYVMLYHKFIFGQTVLNLGANEAMSTFHPLFVLTAQACATISNLSVFYYNMYHDCINNVSVNNPFGGDSALCFDSKAAVLMNRFSTSQRG